MKSRSLLSERRDFRQLLIAMSEVLRVLSEEGNEEAALDASFDAVAAGFGACAALLLLVEAVDPLRLRCLQSRGPMTTRQVHACERGESVKGVSPSLIRQVVATRNAEVVEDPRLHASARRTASLAGDNYSVLCAPVLDALRDTTLAVIYLQNSGLSDAYTPADLAWLMDDSHVLGRLFGLYFENRRRQQSLSELLASGHTPADAPELIGDSPETLALRRELHQTYIPSVNAPHADPVLLLGEPGTGKDLLARYIHAYSSRGNRPFVAVNCAEITDEMATARFFGHRKGAFTGALLDEPGFFRAAQGGILFLDEVVELSPRAQAGLLRVLENRTIVPVGEAREIRVDVGVLVATNRDPDQAVRDGKLRKDFYDRFGTQTIRLAPLRERPLDIPPLLEHFRSHHEARMRKRTLGYTREALRRLVVYRWPGNVRELARVCSLLVAHARPGEPIGPDQLHRCYPAILTDAPNPKAAPLAFGDVSLGEAVRAFQRQLILSRLEDHGGSAKATRQSLGLSKATFHRYTKSLGIRVKRRTEDASAE